MPLASILRSISAEESSRLPPQPHHAAVMYSSLGSQLYNMPPTSAQPLARAVSHPRPHDAAQHVRQAPSSAPPPLPPMLRRQKGVERSAEDLAASIAAAHAMLGLNPEPALAQLGISRMALEAIMKQPDPIREPDAYAAQPPPPENLMRMPLARRPTSFEHAPCSAPGDGSSSAAGQSGQSHTSQPKLRKPPPMGQPPMPPPVLQDTPPPLGCRASGQPAGTSAGPSTASSQAYASARMPSASATLVAATSPGTAEVATARARAGLPPPQPPTPPPPPPPPKPVGGLRAIEPAQQSATPAIRATATAASASLSDVTPATAAEVPATGMLGKLWAHAPSLSALATAPLTTAAEVVAQVRGTAAFAVAAPPEPTFDARLKNEANGSTGSAGDAASDESRSPRMSALELQWAAQLKAKEEAALVAAKEAQQARFEARHRESRALEAARRAQLAAQQLAAEEEEQARLAEEARRQEELKARQWLQRTRLSISATSTDLPLSPTSPVATKPSAAAASSAAASPSHARQLSLPRSASAGPSPRAVSSPGPSRAARGAVEAAANAEGVPATSESLAPATAPDSATRAASGTHLPEAAPLASAPPASAPPASALASAPAATAPSAAPEAPTAARSTSRRSVSFGAPKLDAAAAAPAAAPATAAPATAAAVSFATQPPSMSPRPPSSSPSSTSRSLKDRTMSFRRPEPKSPAATSPVATLPKACVGAEGAQVGAQAVGMSFPRAALPADGAATPTQRPTKISFDATACASPAAVADRSAAKVAANEASMERARTLSLRGRSPHGHGDGDASKVAQVSTHKYSQMQTLLASQFKGLEAQVLLAERADSREEEGPRYTCNSLATRWQPPSPITLPSPSTSDYAYPSHLSRGPRSPTAAPPTAAPPTTPAGAPRGLRRPSSLSKLMPFRRSASARKEAARTMASALQPATGDEEIPRPNSPGLRVDDGQQQHGAASDSQPSTPSSLGRLARGLSSMSRGFRLTRSRSSSDTRMVRPPSVDEPLST